MTTTDPTAADLRASLLAALAAAGHPAAFGDRYRNRLTFAADGAEVEVEIDAASSGRGCRPTPARIFIARYTLSAKRFAPLSGRFDWPLVAKTTREIATALLADELREAERARILRSAQDRADAINASLGLVRGTALHADAQSGRVVLTLRATEASEEQVRVMAAAARACGLMAAS